MVVDAVQKRSEPHPVFRPLPALRNPHVQSVLASLAWRVRWVERDGGGIVNASQRILIECEDGTRLVAFHTAVDAAKESKGTAILFHGWEGSTDSAYLVCLGRHLHRLGYEVFRVNFRDHGGTHDLNPGIFHSCRLEEMILATREIARLSRRGPNYLIGYSLGGNFALRIANEAPRRGIEIEHVLAVSPVIDPARCLDAIEQAPWFYESRFVKRWADSLRLKERAFPERYRFGPLGPCSLRSRTEMLVERFTDFAGLADYLDGYSIAGDRLAGLTCPAWILAAEDDPIVPADDLRRINPPATLEIEIQRWGGHCGFIEDFSLRSWTEGRIADILEKSSAT